MQSPLRPGMDVYDQHQRYLGTIVGFVRGWKATDSDRSTSDVRVLVVQPSRFNPLGRVCLPASRITAISLERVIIGLDE